MRGLIVFAMLVASACGSSDRESGGGGEGEGGGIDAGDLPRQKTFGGDRPVTIITPNNYDHSTPTPIIFVLHGLGANGSIQAAYTGLSKLPLEREVIVVAPDGTKQSDGTAFWNATDACCDFEGSGVDDSGYLRGLVDEIGAVWNIDRDRVFLFGHSNGGFMSYRLACDHADTFAALVSLAGATYLNPENCSPSEAVSVLQIHGNQDATVPYDGTGLTPSASATTLAWGKYAGCSGGLVDSGETVDVDSGLVGEETGVERVDGCPAGISAELWTIEMGKHIPTLTNDFPQKIYNWLDSQARSQ